MCFIGLIIVLFLMSFGGWDLMRIFLSCILGFDEDFFKLYIGLYRVPWDNLFIK